MSAPDSEKDGARAFLGRLLPRILEDGQVDDDERRRLAAVVGSGLLEPAEVHEIFRAFLADLASGVLADGIVTDAERERFRAALLELRLPLEYMPPDMFSVLG